MVLLFVKCDVLSSCFWCAADDDLRGVLWRVDLGWISTGGSWGWCSDLL